MADDVATVGVAQVEVTANLDRLERELARAEAATRRFDQAAVAALDRSKAKADSTQKAYESFSAAVQKSQQAFAQLSSQLGGTYTAKLQELKAATDAAANSYGKYTAALQAAGAAQVDFQTAVAKTAAAVQTTTATLTPVMQLWGAVTGAVGLAGRAISAVGSNLGDFVDTAKQKVPGLASVVDAFSGQMAEMTSDFAAATAKFDFLSGYWDKATKKIAEATDLITKASTQHVNIEFFKGMENASKKLALSLDQLFEGFQNLQKISRVQLGGSALDMAIARLRMMGELKGNTGVEAYRVAISNIDKFTAVNKIITEAYQKGQMLAALDLAEKWLPPDLYERFRAFPDILEQINKKIKEGKPKDTATTFFAQSIQNQVTDAETAITKIGEKWAKEMAKPWLERPWYIVAFFKELGERITEWGNLADAQVKKFIFGLTGSRPQINQTFNQIRSDLTQALGSITPPGKAARGVFANAVNREDEALAFIDRNDPAYRAMLRLQRGAISPARAGFPQDLSSQKRLTQEYADSVTKLSVEIRDYTKVIQQAQTANEVYRAVLGGDIDETTALGQAYRLAKEHIAELGVSVGEGLQPLDESAGAIARLRLETTLWDAATKTAITTGQPLEAFLQREGPRIREFGKALQDAIETKQFAADMSTIVASLGAGANAEEIMLTKQLRLNQVLATTHGLENAEQQARAKQVATIEVNNQFLSRRVELMGDAATITDTMAALENKLALASLAQVNISEREAAAIRQNTFERAAGVRALQNQADASKAEAATINMATSEGTELKLILDYLNQAMREGKVLTEEQVKAFAEWAHIVGLVTQETAALNAQVQLTNNIAAQNIAIRGLTAKSPAERADIAAAQKRNELEREFVKYKNDSIMTAKLEEQVAKAREVTYKTETAALTETARVRKEQAEFSVQAAKADLQSAGLSIGEQYKVTQAVQLRQQLEAEASAHHTKVNEKEYQELLKLVNANGDLRQAMAERKAMSDALFESQTLFFSDTERQIATLQRSIHGDTWKNFMNDGLAATIRITSAMRELRDLMSSAAVTFVNSLAEGNKIMDALKSSAAQFGTALLEAGTKALVNQALSSASTSLTTAATSVASIIGIAVPTAAATLPPAGVAAGAAVATGGATGGAALEAGGIAAGAAILGPIAALGAVAAGIGISLFAKGGQKDQAAQELYQQQVQAYQDSQMRAQDYKRRAQLAVIDSETLTGQLQAFDIEANRQRKEEAKKALPQMAALEKALAAERLKIINDFRKQTLEAEKSFKESFVDEPLTDVAQRMKDMTEQGNKLIDALNQLGDSTAEVTAMMQKAVERMRVDFVEGLQRDLDSATGRGYINDLKDLIKATNQRRADAALLGITDTSAIDRLFKAQAQNLIDNADLMGTAFDELILQFPELTGIVHESTKSIEELGKTIDEYLNGLKFGQLSTLNQAQQFAAAQTAFKTAYTLSLGKGPEAQAARGTITQVADQLLTIARSFLGPTEAYRKLYDEVTSQLASLPGQITAAATGGLIKRGMAAGGMVGNGIWNFDSVLAKYTGAGGGSIALAGGEYVVPAPAVTAATLPALESLRRTGSFGGGPVSANDNAVVIALRGSNEELRMMRNETRALLTALARVAAGGNVLAEQLIRELLNLRVDTRQSAATIQVRQQKAS